MGECIDQSLRDGEDVVHEAHLSLWSLLPGFLTGALILTGSVLSVYFLSTASTPFIGGVASAAFIVAGVWVLTQTLATYYTTELAVINKRVI